MNAKKELEMHMNKIVEVAKRLGVTPEEARKLLEEAKHQKTLAEEYREKAAEYIAMAEFEEEVDDVWNELVHAAGDISNDDASDLHIKAMDIVSARNEAKEKK